MTKSPLSLAYGFLFSFPDFGFTSSMVYIPISKGKFHCQILLTLQHIFDSPIGDQPGTKVLCQTGLMLTPCCLTQTCFVFNNNNNIPINVKPKKEYMKRVTI